MPVNDDGMALPYDYLALALRDTGLVELRWLGQGSARSGLYDQLGLLVAATEAIADADTVYASLNAPSPRRATNRMSRRRCLRDDDIGYVVRLPFDFDPVRPKGANATGAEVAGSEARRDAFVSSMTKWGWPMPLIGMSGNGAHAVYRCHLPATRELRDTLARVYTALHASYSDAAVEFDRTVRNPSRPWRIYGTANRKAPTTEGRPQRTATCVIPDPWECVTLQDIERLAAECAQPAREPGESSSVALGTGDYGTLDAAAWFKAHGRYRRWLDGDKHAVACPWGAQAHHQRAGWRRGDLRTAGHGMARVLLPARALCRAEADRRDAAVG